MQYTSSRYSFSQYSIDNETAAEVVKKYFVKSKITVYYNPFEPSDAVLERGNTTTSWAIIIPNVIMAMIGGITLVLARRRQSLK